MQEIINAQLDEKYYLIKHRSGLTIYVLPKAGYKSSCAFFATKYGSIDTEFMSEADGDFITVPEGIAHFLEHKLFESEELDAFQRYAKTGARANAYTSFDKTCYFFTCTDNFKESFEILLDFVQSPYFTEATVEKEQGIIAQEIQMYDDSPSWRVFFNLLTAMYHKHPVKTDIAGTVQSIRKIDAELLYKCYGTFYNLRNMVLCVAGAVDVDEVMEIADRMLKDAPILTLQRRMPEEPREIVTHLVRDGLEVKTPLFALGYKESCDGEKSLKEKLEAEVLLEAVAGSSSELYKRLFDMGIINDGFDSQYFCGNGYAAAIFEGESSNPEKVRDEIMSEIERLCKKGIDEAAFESARKMLYGRAIMGLSDAQNVANEIVSCHFEGCGIFDDIEIYKSMTKEAVERRMYELFDSSKCALSIVEPIESEVKTA